MKSRRRYGITIEEEGNRMITCIVTGEMSDGTKVWQECDPATREVIDHDHWYMLYTRGNWSEFVRQ